ncbi:MAG: MaoC family protein [Polyangiaceae bacterium]|nr:MaoC family protein [Polyangiaceae bacterium]
MPIDLTTLGWTTRPYELSYDWRTLATYALGVGAKRDELPFLYEGTAGGMKVLPTFGVVPAHAPVVEALTKTGGNLAMIVHGAQTVRAHRSIPDQGTLSTTAHLKAIYDIKKFAQVIVETSTTHSGELVYETVWSIIFRGEGNFGGERPPRDESPSAPKDREPDWSTQEATSPEQALLYRISGDQNPLHADPVFAANVGFTQGPILHGLCTFGFLARAVVKNACGGDPDRLRSISAQFRRPVWPGDTLKMSGFDIGEGKVALTTSVIERDEAVLGSAYAVIGRG